MDYTIIVPTNSRPYCLARLFYSLKHLPKPRQILVGNSTPKEAPQWVHRWYDELLEGEGLLVRQLLPNRCPGGARRELLEHCGSPYVLMLDDDVILTQSSKAIFEPLVTGSADIVGGPWLQGLGSDYVNLIGEEQARALELINIVAPDIQVNQIGFTYSFSEEGREPRHVLKAPVSCSLGLDALIFLDDLIPNIALRTEILAEVNFDDQFRYFFEWYDFFIQARFAGVRCASQTNAKFLHLPEPYAYRSAAHLMPREDDRERFARKWSIQPLFSGEA